MLKKDVPFLWTHVHTSTFNSLKEALESAATLSWFDPSKKCEIYSDASDNGLGCCLMQDQKPIAFASRSLTTTEKKYSVIEKEFLGIVFALSKFRRMILFCDCTVHTDHKPILGLISKSVDKLPMRIQRWMLNLQGFNVKFSYVQGSSNFLADALSRNPLPSLSDDIPEEENAEWTVCFIAKSLPINLRQVAEATAIDPLLQSVLVATQSGWSSHKIQPFYNFRDEITVKESNGLKLLFKGNRLIMPSSLVQDFLTQIHEGHIGLTKMKDIVRSTAYWQGYCADVENFVKRCSACSMFETSNCKPPLQPIADSVTFPYEQIAIDLTGPSEATDGKVLLTCIDLFSRYPEAYIIKNPTSKEISRLLRLSFARFGIPKQILSHNGSVFVSVEISDFFQRLGIKHIRCSNYHPMANGCVERFHGTLKKRIAKIRSLADNVDFCAALDRALFDIRTTPNSMTGVTPAKLFLGRDLRNTLSLLTDAETVASKRFSAGEYMSRKSTKCDTFQPGEHVFFRKGKSAFIFTGQVLKQTGPYTYLLLDLGNQQQRGYNVRDLKRKFHIEDSVQDAVEAYENAIGEGNEGQQPNRTEHDGTRTSPTPKYNLRERSVPISAYRGLC